MKIENRGKVVTKIQENGRTVVVRPGERYENGVYSKLEDNVVKLPVRHAGDKLAKKMALGFMIATTLLLAIGLYLKAIYGG